MTGNEGRLVPERFQGRGTEGRDAQKAWLHGFDTALALVGAETPQQEVAPEAKRVIDSRREQHESALRGWKEPDGFLLPTEPDPDERRRIRDCLHTALTELSLIEHALKRDAIRRHAAIAPAEGSPVGAEKTQEK